MPKKTTIETPEKRIKVQVSPPRFQRRTFMNHPSLDWCLQEVSKGGSFVRKGSCDQRSQNSENER